MKALDEILTVARNLAAEGINVEVLDLGGGYGITYAAEQPLDVELMARGLEAAPAQGFIAADHRARTRPGG